VRAVSELVRRVVHEQPVQHAIAVVQKYSLISMVQTAQSGTTKS
jgi:hypothetical protein